MSSASDPCQQCPPSSSTLVVSDYFRGVQKVSMGDNANISTVYGDQHIHYSVQKRKKVTRFIVGTEEEEAEYDQFPEVKRSEFVAIRNIHCTNRQWIYDKEQKGRKWVECERTVIAGEVRIGGVSSKCLVVQYTGQGAEEVWKEDFRQFGGVRRPQNAQLAAINLSSIPMLILTGDLVPLAHLKEPVDQLGRAYLGGLERQMGCLRNDLWMDTSRGVFCRGPEGPWCDKLPRRIRGVFYGVPPVRTGRGWVSTSFDLRDLPLDTELVREDVLIRYLANKDQDRKVVRGLSSNWHYKTRQIKVNQPTVISTLTDTILAVGSGVWKDGWWSCLGEREELANGMTKFTLLRDGRRRRLRNRRRLHNGRRVRNNQRPLELQLDWKIKYDWLAQAPSIFHAHSLSLDDKMHTCKLVLPSLRGSLSKSKVKQQRRKECPPIYLFVPPIYTSLFWSFDPDGQNPIAADLCHHLGLPISLELCCEENYWQPGIYKALQAYQIARGFNPKTTEFAQHNGYNIFEAVEQTFSSCVEEIVDSELGTESSLCSEELGDMFLGVLFDDVQPEDSATSTQISPQLSHPKPTTTSFDFTDLVHVDTVEIDYAIPRDLISISPTRDLETISAETQDAIPARANVWSRFIPAFSWAALEDSDIPSAGF